MVSAAIDGSGGHATDGSDPHERTATRTNCWNGHRSRNWETRVGSVQLAIPKLRHGTYYPEFLEPRRRSEQALVSVIQEAYVQGISTRKVDQLVQSLGMTGVSQSHVSQLCGGLDERFQRFKQRPLESPYPYVWLDAKYLTLRLVGAVLMEYNDEWAAFPRRYVSQTSMEKLQTGADVPEELFKSPMQLA
jgi:transposase-like protein